MSNALSINTIREMDFEPVTVVMLVSWLDDKGGEPYDSLPGLTGGAVLEALQDFANHPSENLTPAITLAEGYEWVEDRIRKTHQAGAADGVPINEAAAQTQVLLVMSALYYYHGVWVPDTLAEVARPLPPPELQAACYRPQPEIAEEEQPATPSDEINSVLALIGYCSRHSDMFVNVSDSKKKEYATSMRILGEIEEGLGESFNLESLYADFPELGFEIIFRKYLGCNADTATRHAKNIDVLVRHCWEGKPLPRRQSPTRRSKKTVNNGNGATPHHTYADPLATPSHVDLPAYGGTQSTEKPLIDGEMLRMFFWMGRSSGEAGEDLAGSLGTLRKLMRDCGVS